MLWMLASLNSLSAHAGATPAAERGAVTVHIARVALAPAAPVLSPEAESQLVHDLEALTWDTDRVDHLLKVAQPYQLDSAQIARLMEPLRFDRTREQALVALHPQAADPDAYDLALSTLTFPSARERALEALTPAP